METATKIKAHAQVLVQKDYSVFKYINGNRNVNTTIVEKIIENYKSGIDLFAYKPILVGIDYSIYDGQHRFEACKKLGLPVYYMVITGQTLNNLIALNNAQKSWTQNDYLNSFIKLGNKNYIELKEFRDRHKVSLGIAMELLSGISGGYSSFKTGGFKIKSAARAERLAKVYHEMGKLAPKIKTRQTTRSLLVMDKIEGYSHERMIQKLSYQKTKAVGCETVNDQLRMFEEIYNFKSRDGELRFF